MSTTSKPRYLAHPTLGILHTQRLEILKAELESSRLEVVLVPLNPRLRGFNEGGCKRVLANRNCGWYRKHCAAHHSSRVRNHRKPDTKIKRADTLRILERLIAGKPSKSKYAPELLSFALSIGPSPIFA